MEERPNEVATLLEALHAEHPESTYLQFEVIEGDPRRLSLLRIRGITRQTPTTGD